MKKKLITAAVLTVAAITLVVATVFTTLAFLADSAAVSNVFTVGNIAITMFETKVDNNGVPTTPREEVDTNSYHLVPSNTYTKDPTIRITSSTQDTMFLFVKSSNQIRGIEAGNNGGAQLTMRKQMEANGWVEYVMSKDGIDVVWVYGTRDDAGVITPTPVSKNSTQVGTTGTGVPGEFRLCQEFTIASGADVSLYSAAKVSFTAFAIQKDGVNDTHKAWETIKETFPYEGGIIDPVNPYDNSKGPYEPVPKTQP